MKQVLAVAIATLALVGCSTLRRTFSGDIYRVDRPWFDSRTERLEKEDCDEVQIDLASYCFPDRSPKTEDDKRSATQQVRCGDKNTMNVPICTNGITAYEAAVYSASARDALQDRLIELSNYECSKHKAAVFGTNTGSNLIMSTLASLLSGAATGFAAETTKTALSGGSTFVIAAQSHFNEQVYRQMFVGTIIKAIDDDRTARLAEIYDRRRYPVPFAAPDPRVTGSVVGDGFGVHRDPYFRAPEIQAGPTSKASRDSKEEAASPGAIIPTEGKTAVSQGETSEQQPPATVSREVTPPQQLPLPPGPSALSNAFRRLFEEPRADQRLSYSVEEAVRDAADYHDRCSFYNGLVRVAAAVQAFSPCEILQTRRDRLLAELAAIRAAGEQEGSFRDRFASFTAELKTVESKLQTCGQATDRK